MPNRDVSNRDEPSTFRETIRRKYVEDWGPGNRSVMIAEEEWHAEEIEAAGRVIAQIEEEIEDLRGADPERLAERQPEDLPPGYRRTPEQIEDRIEHQIDQLRAEKGAFRLITLPEEEKDEIREARAKEEMRADAARW